MIPFIALRIGPGGFEWTEEEGYRTAPRLKGDAEWIYPCFSRRKSAAPVPWDRRNSMGAPAGQRERSPEPHENRLFVVRLDDQPATVALLHLARRDSTRVAICRSG